MAVEIKNIITALNLKISSFHVTDKFIYVGHSGGQLSTYDLNGIKLSDHNTSRKLIETIFVLNQANALVIIADSILSLHSLDNLNNITTLSQSKTILCSDFLNSELDVITAEAAMTGRKSKPLSSRLKFKNQSKSSSFTSKLAIGLKKKICIYTWINSEQSGVIEVPLSTSPRAIKILNPYTIFVAYSQTEYAIINFDSKLSDVNTVNDLNLPTSNATYTSTFTAGITGFLTNRLKPLMIKLDSGSMLLVKNDFFIVFNEAGRIQRAINVPSTVEEIVYAKPYIYATFPPYSGEQSFTLNLYSSYTMELVQVIKDKNVKFLTPKNSIKSPLYFMQQENGNTNILSASIASLNDSVEKSLSEGKYDEALGLIESVEESESNEDFSELKLRLLQLYSISLMDANEVDDAIDVFIELETNPAKVIALFPEYISGRLYTSRDEWNILFGNFSKLHRANVSVVDDTETLAKSTSMTSLFSESDKLSLHSNRSKFDEEKIKTEALLRYLTDRRQKIQRAINNLQISQTQAKSINLSDYTRDELFQYPSKSTSEMNEEDLIIFASVVDTALFKVYIETRPALIGSLCRLENYCQPEEVEQSLLERKKFSELISLYKSKGMHQRSLDLLYKLCIEDEEKDIEPSVSYIKQLGVENFDLILQNSRWMFDIDQDEAMQIFIADNEKVEELPRLQVAQFLDSFNSDLSAVYLSHIINNLKDYDPVIHNTYADILLNLTIQNKQTDQFKSSYETLLEFLNNSKQYNARERLKNIPFDDLYHARAILVDRLGKYDEALKIYAKSLGDFESAQRYCIKVEYKDKEIFQKLLKFYLKLDKSSTPPSSQSSYFKPMSPPPTQSPTTVNEGGLNEAVILLSKFPTKFDMNQTLKMLPSITTLKDLNRFLLRSYRSVISKSKETSIVTSINKAHNDNLAFDLINLERRNVIIDDNRMCPQCKKRIGNSVISIHSPYGQVTHLGCKDQFASKINQNRIKVNLDD